MIIETDSMKIISPTYRGGQVNQLNHSMNLYARIAPITPIKKAISRFCLPIQYPKKEPTMNPRIAQFLLVFSLDILLFLPTSSTLIFFTPNQEINGGDSRKVNNDRILLSEWHIKIIGLNSDKNGELEKNYWGKYRCRD